MTNKSRHILNDEIRNDYARLLEIINDPREPAQKEITYLASKYRMRFNLEGKLLIDLEEGEY